MEVDVVRVPPAGDLLSFGGSHLYLSAPLISSLSAPTSPSHAFNFFRFDDDDDNVPNASPSAVPFLWEEKPGTPKSSGDVHDFEFDFTAQYSLSKASLPADELFHGGKIKPLKPPPGFQSNMWSPRSPPNSRFSPRKSKISIGMNINDDPFEAALMKETLSNNRSGRTTDKISYISSNFARKPTRSLSPFRISSETALDGDDLNSLAGAGEAKSSSFLSAISFSKLPSRRWRLRDLLFRSATEKPHNLRSSYVAMDEDVNISSFRSADGGGSRLHFTPTNRSVSEEFMKKKSFLPNKPGFLSRCLRFNRSGTPEISRGIGSLTRG